MLKFSHIVVDLAGLTFDPRQDPQKKKTHLLTMLSNRFLLLNVIVLRKSNCVVFCRIYN